MSIAAMHAAFDQAAKGALRVHHIHLRQIGGKQVVYAVGWHADGTPFEMMSAPFDGSPIAEAAILAHDIIDHRAQMRVAKEVAAKDHDLLASLARVDVISSPQVAYTPPLTGRPMATPTPIKGLAGKLREHLARATARAERLAAEMEGSVTNFHSQMDGADRMKKEIDDAAEQVRQVVGTETGDNGGPK